MRKLFITFQLVVICMMVFTGCGKKDKDPIEVEVEVDQMASPVKGETVAEIVIKDFGSIHVRFFEEAAPKAVENFTTHAKNGYYDGLTFHRVIEDFMIQGGDPTGTGRGGESIWGDDFQDEFAEELHPYRGALCMANRGKNTNSSQFFIVQALTTYDAGTLKSLEAQVGTSFSENAIEKYGTIGGTPWLYKAHTVFGQIYEGYEVLDAVASVEKLDEANGIPLETVVIEKIIIREYDK